MNAINFIRRSFRVLVAEAFASLPKDEQSILILRFVLDLTDEEIGRLMVQNQLAIAVKLAPFTVFAGDRFHLLTPFLWGMWWFSPFPPIERMESLWLPAKRLLFSLF